MRSKEIRSSVLCCHAGYCSPQKYSASSSSHRSVSMSCRLTMVAVFIVQVTFNVNVENPFNIIDIVFESAFGNGVASDIGRAVAPGFHQVRRQELPCMVLSSWSRIQRYFVICVDLLMSRVFLLAWRPSAGLVSDSCLHRRCESRFHHCEKSAGRKHCQNIVSFFFHLWCLHKNPHKNTNHPCQNAHFVRKK